MGKHEVSAGGQTAQPTVKKNTKKAAPSNSRKRKVLPLVLVAACTGLLLLAVFILRSPEVGAFGNKPNTEDPVQPVDPQPGDPGQSETPPVEVPPEEIPKVLKEEFYTFLLVGSNDNWNTDTLMLCSVDVAACKVNMISIPRDSMVDRDVSLPKINAAYGRDGIEELCTEVTEVTGVPINYYCFINVNAFVKVVDLIGGVDYNVPIRMYHADSDPAYAIDLQAGQQNLNGREAAQFCRFRGTSENDFGRMNRQKDFLLATLRQVRANFSISQVEGFIDIFNESVKTNMPARDMIWFYINVLDKLDLSEDVSTATLPYTHTGYYKSQDYVYLDAAGIVELVNDTVNPYTTDITEEDLRIVCRED